MKKINKLIIASSVLLGITSFAVAADGPTKKTPTKFDASQVQEIQGIVKSYLINNPEVLAQTAEALKQKQMLARKKAADTAISKNKAQLFDDPNSPSVGSANPKVYLVEFFDYQCGHCKDLQKPLEALLKANPTLKIIFKDFPIFGRNSEAAAQVALAANEQGKYIPVHNALMNAGNPMTEAKALNIAKKAGCDMKQLVKDMGSKKIADVMVANLNLAKALMLQGTPALIFANAKQENTILVPGGMSQMGLQSMVNKEKDSNQ